MSLLKKEFEDKEKGFIEKVMKSYFLSCWLFEYYLDMGGQLIKGYSLEGDSQGVVGLSKAWKLYRGHKAQTHALSSIFLI